MDVIMPQLGETVAEGKIASWFKQVGDKVEAGENLFEIETDKVSMEVQATASGVLSEIRVAAGATVPVGTVVAVVGSAAGAIAATRATPIALSPALPLPNAPALAGEGRVGLAGAPPTRGNGAARTKLAPFDEVHTPMENFGAAAAPLGLKITPLARRLIRQEGLDLAAIAENVKARGGWRIAAADVRARAPAQPGERKPAPLPLRPGDTVEPLNRIRAQTARHLADSWRTVPHVFQAIEVDFSGIERARQALKHEFLERHGAALTYLPFVARALCLALAEFRRLNASFDRNRLILHGDIHLGIAVDLDHKGLIVPVVHHADEMTVGGLAKAIARQVEKARKGKLAPADIEGATYTITNNGSFGTLFTAPIINLPQVAILSLDAVQKRAIVVETEHGDALAPRLVAMVGQSFDHRAVDGAYAAALLRRLKVIAESRDWAGDFS
ncbi:MAG TPA: dihydrolipoamide acetyltransferase family protein [Stellaceae bacterium]|nr:dihydrolipoamide acetyltransferase family protein [Stellaceae bacterium]